MWIIDGGQPQSFFNLQDFWHAFLVFLAMYFSGKFNQSPPKE